jgi:hypothetical protein
MTMNFPAKVICGTLCGVTLLAPLAFSQTQTSAPPPLKGVQAQNGPQRQGQTQTPASTDPRLRAQTLKIKLGPPKSGPKINNPHAALRDAGIIAVLQRQRQTAETQFAQMKAMHASAGLPAMQKQPPISAAAGARVQTIMPGIVSKAGAPPVIGSTKPMDVSGSGSNRMNVAPFLQSVVAACAMSKSDAMSIGQVSGESYPATFTPIEKYNLYTITGCSFGSSNANNKVYIFGKGSFQGNFEIRSWDENSISVALDPGLSGFPDQDNLTLVVQRADGKQASKNGFKFYAARGDANDNPIPLKQIPGGHARLWPSDYFLTEYSAPADDAQGISVQVSRNLVAHKDATNGNVYFDNQNERAVPADSVAAGLDNGWGRTQDVFDLSKLQPSFESLSFDYFYWTPDPRSLCGAWDEQDHKTNEFGKWDFEWADASHITVTVQTAQCWDLERLSKRINVGQQSQYALRVWVSGPRCIDPWSGQPDQKCIADVRAAKKNLGQQ